MKRYLITLDGRTFDILLLSDPEQEQVQVQVDGVAFTAQVKAVPTEEATAAEVAGPAQPSAPPETPVTPQLPGAQTAATMGNAVAAPLPGVIKFIAVRAGQQVSSGDELLVIEAMKMDNVIRASRDGTVETIFVSEGHQVGYGERMLEYAKSGPASASGA